MSDIDEDISNLPDMSKIKNPKTIVILSKFKDIISTMQIEKNNGDKFKWNKNEQ